MKMNVTLTYSDYDKETGISVSTIATELGEFTGVSKLHEEDKDIESSFYGCQVAEAKAIIKYRKAQLRIIDSKREVISNLLKQLSFMKGYDANSLEARKMRKRVYELSAQYKELDEEIKERKARLQYDFQHRRERVNKILERGERR